MLLWMPPRPTLHKSIQPFFSIPTLKVLSVRISFAARGAARERMWLSDLTDIVDDKLPGVGTKSSLAADKSVGTELFTEVIVANAVFTKCSIYI